MILSPRPQHRAQFGSRRRLAIKLLTTVMVTVLVACAPAYAAGTPETYIDSGPPGTTTATSASFSFHASKPATFRCSLDGATYQTCSSPKSYALGMGSHTFRVFAVDKQGRPDPSPAWRSSTVVASAPSPPSPPSPSSVVYVAPTEGARVSGLTAVRVRAPAGTDWIAVYACGGQSVGEDSVVDAGGEWSVQWDTRSCPNGQQDLDSWAFRDGGASLGNATITTQVSNSAPAPAPEPVACEPVSAPGPIAGQGYGERFSDCFDTLDRTTWCSHQWWEANPPVGSQTVANGELRLRRDRANGYADTTMSTEPCGQANPKSFQYGYFEARMRHETVQGNGPAFWLFSTRHATNPAWPAINPLCAVGGQFLKAQCLSAELDVFEGFGRIFYGGSRTDDFFSGTLHRNSSGHYGESNQSRFVQRGTGLEMEDWHVYAARWTPTEIRYYIDGQLQGTVAPFDSTAQPMHLLLYNWNTEWEDENMPNASTEPELDTYVDWVRVWQQ